jgi:hypothetical protein
MSLGLLSFFRQMTSQPLTLFSIGVFRLPLDVQRLLFGLAQVPGFFRFARPSSGFWFCRFHHVFDEIVKRRSSKMRSGLRTH